MGSIMPAVSADGRYTVKETCELLGVKSRQTLASYVKQGLIKECRRRTNNRPFYTGREILRCWTAIS